MALCWASFSTWLHLLTAPLGREHPCQQPTGTRSTKSQDQRGTTQRQALEMALGVFCLTGGKCKPPSREKSPRHVRFHRGVFRWRKFGSQQVCSDFCLSKTHAWCPGCSECTCFYGFAAKHILPKRKRPSMVCRAELR